MIIVWLSHKNRRARRAAMARARRSGAQIVMVRAEGDVSDQTGRLLVYLLNPDPHNLASLLEQGDVNPELLRYLTGAKRTAATPEMLADLKAGFGLEHNDDDDDDDRTDDEAADRERLDGALKELHHHPNSERVLQVVTRNLFTQTVEDQQLELSLVAGLAPGTESPIEHLVVSWPDGVTPTPDQVEALIDLLLKIWRMERHQLFAAVHGDTEHVHIHIAVNRVDPLRGERVAFGGDEAWALDTLHQSIAVAANRFGWPTADKARYRADETGCYDRSSGLRVLDDKLAPFASKTDWRRINEIRKREERGSAISSEARRFEIRTGFLSLERVAREQLADIFKEAVTWPGLHAELAERGVEYIMSPSKKGAQLVFAGRTIPASRAWSGASLDKLTRQIGEPFVPRDDKVPVAPFGDQEYPALRAALLRRQQLTAMRAESQFERQASADVLRSIAATHEAASDAINGKCWIGQRDEMNAARSATATAFRAMRQALEAQAKRRLRARKRRRQLLKLRNWRELFNDNWGGDDALGLLGGPNCDAGGKVDDAEPQFDGTDVDGGREYRRYGRLVYVDRATLIELHAPRDKEAMRAAMRLAHARWGSVQVFGNAKLLSMLVDIAIEENIVITNPSLQPVLAERERAVREREEQWRVFAAQTIRADVDPLVQKLPEPATRPLLPVLPAEYPELIHHWDRLDRAEDDARDEVAAHIANDPKLSEALEELSAQGHPQIARIKAGANRFARQASGEPSMHNAPAPIPPVSAPTKPTSAPHRLVEIVQAQRKSDRDQVSLTHKLLERVSWQRTGMVDAPFYGNMAFVLADVKARPTVYRRLEDPPSVRLINTTPSDRSDEIAVLFFDSNFMHQAHEILRAAEPQADGSRPHLSFKMPPTHNKRPQPEFLAKVAAENDLPRLIDQRPRIVKGGGAYWFADASLTEGLKDNAVVLLTNPGRSQMKAAFLVQEIERADLLSAISEGRATIETVTDGKGGIRNRFAHDDPELAAGLPRFAADAEFAIAGRLAAVEPRTATAERRRHALLHAFQAAADEDDKSTALALCRMIDRHGDKPNIMRQISAQDAKRLDKSKPHEAELRRIWMDAHPRAQKSKGHKCPSSWTRAFDRKGSAAPRR